MKTITLIATMMLLLTLAGCDTTGRPCACTTPTPAPTALTAMPDLAGAPHGR